MIEVAGDASLENPHTNTQNEECLTAIDSTSVLENSVMLQITQIPIEPFFEIVS